MRAGEGESEREETRKREPRGRVVAKRPRARESLGIVDHAVGRPFAKGLRVLHLGIAAAF